jgi:mannose-1-phosphate guanylyltransferase
MRALLLAAGFGTRLRPLTQTIPKCLVPIHGRPLLELWLERLTNNGVGPLLINTHYLHEQVESFVQHCKYADQTTLAHESQLLGTAGTLIANYEFFAGEDAMLVHADNYCLPNISAFVNAHRNRPAQCLMTMMTFVTESPSSCGIVEVNSAGIVTAFHEKVKNPPGNIANGAVYILSDSLLQYLASTMGHVTDFSTEVLPTLVGRIFNYAADSIFIDIGSPENYRKANALSFH